MTDDDWPSVKLGDHAKVKAGYAFDSDEFTDNPEDIPLVKGSNVQQGYIAWEDSKYWPREKASEYDRFFLEEGDVVLAMDRPWVQAGLKWAWIRQGDPPALLVQRIARLRSKGSLDQNFLRYLIGSQQFEDYIRPIVTGVNVPHISGEQIENFSFNLPPLDYQRKAASLLSTIDELIQNNLRRTSILEEIAEILYVEWFVNFRFSGYEDVESVDSQIGTIPEGWRVQPFSEVVEINPRERPDKEEMKPYVPMGSVSTNSMVMEPIEERDGNSGAKFRNDDTLFAKITPSLENGKTGFVRFLGSEDDVGLGSGELLVFRSLGLCPELVYLIARDEEFRQNAIKSMTGASGRQRVQTECFDDYLIAVPPQDVIQDFQQLVGPMFDLIFSLSERNNRLEQIRDLLQPRLLQGKINISEMDFPMLDIESEVMTT